MNEIERINNYTSGEKIVGWGWQYRIENNDKKLANLIQVVKLIASHSPNYWPSDEKWKDLLPKSLLASFREYSQEEVKEIMQNLSIEERHNLPWDYGSWLDAIKIRGWYWWSVAYEKEEIRILISINNWPASLEAFEYLIRISGLKILSNEEISQQHEK